MVDLDELEKGVGVPVGSRREESIPKLAYVFPQTLLAYSVQAFGVVETGTEDIDCHPFGHRLRQISDVEVEGVELCPCVPIEMKFLAAVVVCEAIRQLEVDQVCAVDHRLDAEEEFRDGSGEQDAPAYCQSELIVVGDPSEYLLFVLEGVGVASRCHVEVKVDSDSVR